MRDNIVGLIIVAVMSVGLAACGPGGSGESGTDTSTQSGEECEPGRSVSCACAGGASGVQTCRDDGSWSSCECEEASDAGRPGDAADASGTGDEDTAEGGDTGPPSGWGHSTDAERTLIAKQIDADITVDGAFDEEAYRAAHRVGVDDPSGGSDNSLTARALWSDQMLYIGVEVEDDEIATPLDEEIWHRDSIQTYIDRARDRHSGGMLADDYNLIVDAAGRTLARQGGSDGQNEAPGIDLATEVVESADGYRVEMAVAWDDLEASPSLGQRMGFLLANNDRADGDRVSYAWGMEGGFGFPSKWGDLRLGPGAPGDDPNIDEESDDQEEKSDNKPGCDIFSEPPGSNVVDLGQQGLSPGDTIDPYLEQWFDDGNEVHVPKGTYEWDGDWTGGQYAEASLIGDGEVVLDTGGGYNWNTSFRADGDVEIRNITIKGQAANRSGEHGKTRGSVPESDATLLFRNFNQPDGSAVGAGRVGLYVNGTNHAGELYLVDCHFERFGNNGVYASSPGKSDSGYLDGAVHVIRGLYKNNNIANVRLGSSNSSARGVVSIQDERAPSCCGGSHNQRGIWVREPGDDIRIENSHVTYDASGSGPLQLKARGGGGSGTLEDVRIRNESSQPAVDVVNGDWSGSGLEITGGGDHDVEGGNFSDVCTGAGCEAPRTQPLPPCGE